MLWTPTPETPVMSAFAPPGVSERPIQPRHK